MSPGRPAGAVRPAEVADAFCGSRLGTSYDGTFGTLASPVADLAAIVERPTPVS